MNINCGKCGKLMNITEPQNYGEAGGEHVVCPMSWQEEYTKRYEERLRERWGVDGHPLNEHRRTKEVRMLWEASQKAHQQAQGMPSDEYMRHVDKYNAMVNQIWDENGYLRSAEETK